MIAKNNIVPRIQLNGNNVSKSKIDTLTGGNPYENIETGNVRIIKCKFIDNK